MEEIIKEWVQLDNQSRIYNDKLKTIRERKQALLDKMTEENETFSNELHNKTINISDGRLIFSNTRVSTPLSYKFLQSHLGTIIRNESQVEQIIKYLKQNREIKLVPEIKRFS